MHALRNISRIGRRVPDCWRARERSTPPTKLISARSGSNPIEPCAASCGSAARSCTPPVRRESGGVLFEHDLLRKPLHTFRDHALVEPHASTLLQHLGPAFGLAANERIELRRCGAADREDPEFLQLLDHRGIAVDAGDLAMDLG